MLQSFYKLSIVSCFLFLTSPSNASDLDIQKLLNETQELRDTILLNKANLRLKIEAVDEKYKSGSAPKAEDINFLANFFDNNWGLYLKGQYRSEGKIDREMRFLIMRVANLLFLQDVKFTDTVESKRKAAERTVNMIRNGLVNGPLIANSFLVFDHMSENDQHHVVFNANSDVIGEKWRLIYALSIIQLNQFQNNYGNDYNRRASRILLLDVNHEQVMNYYAPNEATESEKLYQWLHADGIRREFMNKVAITALILGGLAVWGKLAENTPNLNTTVKPFDSCTGLNGLGWIDDTAGNAAALFGCRKY